MQQPYLLKKRLFSGVKPILTVPYRFSCFINIVMSAPKLGSQVEQHLVLLT